MAGRCTSGAKPSSAGRTDGNTSSNDTTRSPPKRNVRVPTYQAQTLTRFHSVPKIPPALSARTGGDEEGRVYAVPRRTLVAIYATHAVFRRTATFFGLDATNRLSFAS